MPLPLLRLIPESLGAAGVGIGLRPPGVGRFDGGAGGVGLPPRAAPLVPLARGAAGGGGGVGRATATGGGGGASSFT